jgi:hypothetical protein
VDRVTGHSRLARVIQVAVVVSMVGMLVTAGLGFRQNTCSNSYARRAAAVQKIRGEATDRQLRTEAEVIGKVLSIQPDDPEAQRKYQAAKDEYFQAAKQIERTRREHPIPDPPDKFC